MNNEKLIRCAYCGEERPKDEMKQAKIIYRARVNGKAKVLDKMQWYCKDKPCAGYDQMAHEG